MTTFNVNSVLAERPLVVGGGNSGYARNRVFKANIPTQAADSISSLTITNAGSAFTGIPAIAFSGGGGSGAAANALMKALTATPLAAGTGYAANDTINLAGGTNSAAAVVQVATTKLITATLNAKGTGYAPGNTITLAGGTSSVAAILTVNTTQLASLAINSLGSGYAVGDTITLAGGTFITPIVLTVASETSGEINTVTVTNAGEYTANSSTLTQGSTSGTGTGVTFNVVLYGVKAFTISTAGSYTVNTATFTQGSTSGSGTGATFNSALYGVNTATISTPGSYSVLPPIPATQASTSGSGTGATFTMSWGVVGATITNSGQDYATAPTVSFSGGGGTGAAATAVKAGPDDPITVSLAFVPALPTASYAIKGAPSQAAELSYANKTVNGVDVTLTPLAGGTLATGTLDVIVQFNQ